MQPRGQLWFEVAKVVRDFRDYSGLGEVEALQVIVAVLTNMLTEQQAELAEALARRHPQPRPGEGPAGQ